MKIYLDIETIPGQNPDIRKEVADAITHPGSMKKPETIERWEIEKKPQAIEDAWRKTSFDGAQGEIVVIGWAIDDAPPQVAMRDVGGDERLMLATFFESVAAYLKDRRPIEWIGHRVREFDLRFIFQRAVILGVQPPFRLPHDARPGSEWVYDTMTSWAGWGGRVSLDRLCKALDIPTKGTELGGEEIDGSKVWDFVQAGRIRDVATYCMGDVDRVRAVYRRMTFQGGA
ncbi:MAG TPA: hypothetical protein ENJ29_05295 [Bacteroidetes bacterium]|nr:hypothetical protein [Bacteroidota bacterium]